MAGEVWRKVKGKAVQCTECAMNKREIVTDNENPLGIDYKCIAKDGICIFLNAKPDNDRWYADFHDIFDEEGEGS